MIRRRSWRCSARGCTRLGWRPCWLRRGSATLWCIRPLDARIDELDGRSQRSKPRSKRPRRRRRTPAAPPGGGRHGRQIGGTPEAGPRRAAGGGVPLATGPGSRPDGPEDRRLSAGSGPHRREVLADSGSNFRARDRIAASAISSTGSRRSRDSRKWRSWRSPRRPRGLPRQSLLVVYFRLAKTPAVPGSEGRTSRWLTPLPPQDRRSRRASCC